MLKNLRVNLLYAAAAGACLFFATCSSAPPQETLKKEDFVMIPLGGNAYARSDSASDGRLVAQNGISRWTDPEKKFDIYFRVNKPGNIKLALELDAENDSEIRVSAFNKSTNLKIAKGRGQFISIGEFANDRVGYAKVSLEGVAKDGAFFPSPIISLGVSGAVSEKDLNFVKNGFSFHFGRRGPSDHLNFEFPADKDIEWFYNEVTIEPGQDVIGSYFMANGFGEGYFGMQVNSALERRMLFSVWSPFDTDNPSEIPEDKRIALLAKGEGVVTGEFGGEGSGGQSYLVYPWKAGVAYKFLNRVRPLEENRTMYTAYFFDPEKAQWRLMASFSRPATSTWYKRPYSFLENFVPHQGQFTRRGLYGNQWARTKDGEWVEITKATFTADDTARKGMRTDYQGGLVGDAFYLQNCGFFSDTTQIGSVFQRPAKGVPPDIDFSKF
ncbi:MAG: DUF3472 domain-containing protein [Holophagales bacterium]|jgi:hypothetical protein|nr:DUF3472 domain-containing protein [Holophagales bacterium]